jgi:hypothetical protein
MECQSLVSAGLRVIEILRSLSLPQDDREKGLCRSGKEFVYCFFCGEGVKLFYDAS